VNQSRRADWAHSRFTGSKTESSGGRTTDDALGVNILGGTESGYHKEKEIRQETRVLHIGPTKIKTASDPVKNQIKMGRISAHKRCKKKFSH
jgi:hypothetical protein